jgi:hypothetical protein
MGRRTSIEGEIRRLWTVGTAHESDDQTLLSCYVLDQHECAQEAFRLLVDRHGPMVLHVRRRSIVLPSSFVISRVGPRRMPPGILAARLVRCGCGFPAPVNDYGAAWYALDSGRKGAPWSAG